LVVALLRLIELLLGTQEVGAEVGAEVTANQAILSLRRRGRHVQIGLLLSERTQIAMGRVIGLEQVAVDLPTLDQRPAVGMTIINPALL